MSASKPQTSEREPPQFPLNPKPQKPKPKNVGTGAVFLSNSDMAVNPEPNPQSAEFSTVTLESVREQSGQVGLMKPYSPSMVVFYYAYSKYSGLSLALIARGGKFDSTMVAGRCR